MKRFLYFIFFKSLFIFPIFSQVETNWMTNKNISILERVMNIEYSHPEGFIGESTGLFCFQSLFSCMQGSLRSEDSSFVAFYWIPNLDSMQNSIHVNLLKKIVKISYGDDNDWEKYVYHYSSDEAKTKFNADNVYLVSVLLNKEEHDFYKSDKFDFYENGYNKNNYTHCKVLITQKRGRGFVAVYCIYNDNAINNLDAYMTAIEGTLRYGESEPELNKLEKDDEDDIVNIYFKPIQPKGKIIGDY